MRDAVDVIIEQWAREKPGFDVSPVGIVGRTARLHALLDKGIGANFARFGLAHWEYDVLASLRRAGAPYRLTVGQLMASMMISSGAMTNRIDRMAARGLLTREPDPADRRGVLVRLTEAGVTMAEQVLVPHMETERDLLSGLSAKEQQQLAALLRKALLSLEGPAPQQ
ncbi:MarR family winged helix-turn-helix transcriptional regulator [Crossiella cryophila]|uniref:DNA-binding MarR family transcriptional regulator n=1 Tax=Crossiella cryophila TaxID=43355 RepID=A0A7W7C5Z6_9PSEU|nr:MarR family transcriptional regulator [Crossiella cryophila]MBB4675149.1 DNA-binding MarR family transcriptional regulator [Crossiella cryophila]